MNYGFDSGGGGGYVGIMSHVIPSSTLRHLLAIGKKALKGDSNDAEHDALHEIVEELKTIRAQGTAEAAAKKDKRQ